MNDHELDPVEVELRTRLQRTLLPPPTPHRLHEQVEQMAAEALAAGARPRRTWSEAIGMGGRAIRFAAGTLAVVAVAVLAVVVLNSRADRTPVAASPHPTLPAFTGPTLPLAPASPTRIEQGAWIDARTAYVIPVGSNAIHMTTDGGLTWSEPRPLPAETDLGLEFVDADHGYTMWSSATTTGTSNVEHLIAYRTSDGGRTWQSAPIGSVTYGAGEGLLEWFHYADRLHGVASATAYFQPTLPSGEVAGPDEPRASWGFATDDGGATWAPLAASPVNVLGAMWADPKVGLGGPFAGDAATVSSTVDGGRTWTSGTLPGVGNGIAFSRQGFFVDGAGVLHLAGTYQDTIASSVEPMAVFESRDAGATWTEAYRSSGLDGASTQSITAFDADHWITVVEVSSETRPYKASELRESWDGGRTWAVVGTLGTIGSNYSSWADRLHGMIQGADWGDCSDTSRSCGGYGTMFLTNDGGRSWHQVPF
jgi:photosystem II stability/assembly factor-like uncharacterized protein